MTDPSPKPPLEQLLDVAVYGPLGVALAVRDRFPELIAAGRKEFDQQVRSARMVGTFAVTQARKEAEKRWHSVVDSSSPEASPDVASPVSDDLPIADYDQRTAAQIVPLLAALTRPQRARVAEHERLHRNRRTVLGRIDQLDS